MTAETITSPRPPIDGGTALITGASSGIGRALAQQLSPRLSRVVLVARRVAELESLASELRATTHGLAVDVEPCDLTDASAIERMLASVRARVGPIDVLVNCAGFGDMALFDRSSWERNERLIDLNVRALLKLTHALVPSMVERRRGGVLNISSGFGMAFGPLFATYAGTKHFVTGFTESLRADLAGTGVVVTQSCPGPVATEFEQNVGNPTATTAPSWIEISAERCARESIAAFDFNRAMVVPGLAIWFVMLLNAVTPRFVTRAVMNAAGAFARRRLAADATPTRAASSE